MRDSQYLFSEIDWFSVDRNRRQQMQAEIAAMPGDRLLNTSPSDLAAHFEVKYRLETPTLEIDQIVADQREAQLDVSRDSNRDIRDRSRASYVNGTTVEIAVPFTGDPELFKVQPTSYTSNPPIGQVRGQQLLLTVSGTNLQPDSVRAEIDRSIRDIQSYLMTLRGNVQTLNDHLNALAQRAIAQRRSKLLADRSLVGSLGFRMKERPGEERTYVTPMVQRKIAPLLPPASSSPYKPEPVLADADYDHILSVLQNMVHVMERSPSAFASMDEEALRSHFLVQLNGHYEGQATGETFNYEGKTDILIRADGKNIFIGECKFWSGPKKLNETIDQLLGYSSWRDTKVVVILFNRNRDFSKVLTSIAETLCGHPNFKRDLGRKSETNFRFTFAHRDDKNRELTLSVLAFDVPA